MKKLGVLVDVMYARFNGKREESIDEQIRAMREYCEKSNIEVLQKYIVRDGFEIADKEKIYG